MRPSLLVHPARHVPERHHRVPVRAMRSELCTRQKLHDLLGCYFWRNNVCPRNSVCGIMRAAGWGVDTPPPCLAVQPPSTLSSSSPPASSLRRSLPAACRGRSWRGPSTGRTCGFVRRTPCSRWSCATWRRRCAQPPPHHPSHAPHRVASVCCHYWWFTCPQPMHLWHLR